MKTAMAVSSCRRLVQGRLQFGAVIFAVALFLASGPRAAIAQGGKNANVFKILQNDAQFSMFYSALVDSTEIWNVEGRTQINGSQLILFAPTNAAMMAALSGGVLQCLQSEQGKAIFIDFLMYLQVVVPISPRVESVQDLLSVSREGKLWTVDGKAISVAEEASGDIALVGDEGTETLTVEKVRVTDPTVTLIEMEESVLVAAETGEKILNTCFGDDVSEPSTVPPTSRRAPPSSSVAASSARASASSRAAPATRSSSSRSAPASSPSKSSRRLLY